ncbi:IS66 family insertion sequence element accessory protein TnpA [Alteromonas macleodii]|uniref:IS66 family insertion sequence element accessory protein TnpA n=1 Tax=Alteromonas macleodii TaxID=28108 RepID=UPI00313EBB03
MPQYQRREVQDWLNLFEQQKQSGLTAVAFCRQQQINVQTYYTRRRDIRLQRTSNKFVQVKREVTKVESYTEAIGGELLLQLGNAQLTVPININPHWIATVMKAMSE